MVRKVRNELLGVFVGGVAREEFGTAETAVRFNAVKKGSEVLSGIVTFFTRGVKRIFESSQTIVNFNVSEVWVLVVAVWNDRVRQAVRVVWVSEHW